MNKSRIEWTEVTWNPVTGCSKISPGCQHCYADVFSSRLQAMGVQKYANAFRLTLHEKELELPYKWKKPKVVFVNSMSDLFHENIPLSFIHKVFKVMSDCQRHVFQMLTKRSERLLALSKDLNWSPNIWMGVSVENDDYVYRIDHLRNSRAHIKFLSLEPLLGPLVNLDLHDIDWVIVGGESGVKARPMKKEWVIDIRDQCKVHGVPFFFKQWGGQNKKRTGRILDGKTYDQMPNRDLKAQSIFVF